VQKTASLTKWAPEPKGVLEGVDPCARKKFELKMPPTPKRDLSAARGAVAAPGTSHEPSQSRNISSLIPGMRSVSEPDVRALLDHTQTWPTRGYFPSVRDIIGFRNTVPEHVTPADLGKLCALKFGWTGNECPVTSEEYVKGVTSGRARSC